MFKYFTVNEANEALPDVVEKFTMASKQREVVLMLEKRLQMSISTNSSLESYMIIKQELNSSVTKFYHAMQILEDTGVSVKSVEQGLLDFPAKRFDKDIWLCWKHGEDQIKFWHDMDTGFAGRKPLAVSDESLV